MSYINDTRKQGEVVLYKAKIHWLIFATPIIILIIGALFPSEDSILFYLRIFLFIFGAYKLVEALSLFIGSEYVVTNYRAVLKEGLLKKEATQLSLSRCENLIIAQSFIGRIFNYGTISIATAGSRTDYKFIINPQKFLQVMNEQI